MKNWKRLARLLWILIILSGDGTGAEAFSQATLNGKFDNINELRTNTVVPFTMPDGVQLMSDISVPVVRDCLLVDFDLGNLNPLYTGTKVPLEIIQRGKQIIIYDSLNGQPNPNPYQLPMLWMRLPYNTSSAIGKDNDNGGVFGLLGYAFGMQNQRGCYSSRGAYLPLYSDSWNKNPYHSNYSHTLDITPLSDAHNANKHEDGYNSIQFILDSLKRVYDYNEDGAPDIFNICNGQIGTVGGSAMGYNQYQAAAAHKINNTKPGLKCMTVREATLEFYKSSGFQNGVFRDALVTGWIKGQIVYGTNDDSIAVDNDIQNSLHTSFDYGMPDKFSAAEAAIDHFCSKRYPDASGNPGPAGYYPNYIGRKDIDASRAMVDANGNGSLNGQFSRYANMEVPAYHMTGWWDIFIDGQIETWNYMRKYLSPSLPNRKLQKLIIGPFVHEPYRTAGNMAIVGDMRYPSNAADVVNIRFSEELDTVNISFQKILKEEWLSWMRYNLNYNPNKYLGEPKFILAENNRWQPVLGGLYYVKVPDTNFLVKHETMLAFLNGTGSLNGLPVTVRQGSPAGPVIYGPHFPITISAIGTPLIGGLDNGQISSVPQIDFMNDIPDVRFYVPGPNYDGIAQNANVGNYWFSSDTFPLASPYISKTKMYLHNSGTLNQTAPVTNEGFKTYLHDPNDPVLTIGGGNMLEQLPLGDSLKDTFTGALLADGSHNAAGYTRSEGQIEMTRFAKYTMDPLRSGVVSFTGNAIQDSLCIIGYPVATLYAKSNPAAGVSGKLTDTDFFIRVLDVYPDGKTYFVVEGCVNARARDYAKNLVDNPQWDENPPFLNDLTPFTNIDTGKIYEYKFKMLPVAYTWGKGHKIKFLISSSNYPRYQVNPNIPIADGEFFRRKPGDGQGTNKTPDGSLMFPRTAVQGIAFSPGNPSNIELPVYVQKYAWNPTFTPEIVKPEAEDFLLFPNPANNEVSVYFSKKSDYTISVTNSMGQLLLKTGITGADAAKIDVKKFPGGIYFLQTSDDKTNRRMTKKFMVVE
ncbi:MAG: T9SS type A sorting domain-containing protein [Bacteroidetes bacterium]|nr:MAG: T9SS type A sorting domain-containing protein [Bacteroidota bacterium]